MSLNIVSFEQSFGTLITGIFCTVGAKGDGPTIVKRANTSLAVAAALSALGTGDVASASAQILSALASNPNLDPAITLALTNSLQIAFTQWQALQAVNSMLPFLSSSVEALITQFATGIQLGAQAELTKYAGK